MDKTYPVAINIPERLFEDLRKSCITNSMSMKQQIEMILRTFYDTRKKD